MSEERIADGQPEARAPARGVDSRTGWVILGVQVAIVAVAVLMLAPTTESLRASWTDTRNLSYTHGYLIAAVCLWLLFRNRNAP